MKIFVSSVKTLKIEVYIDEFDFSPSQVVELCDIFREMIGSIKNIHYNTEINKLLIDYSFIHDAEIEDIEFSINTICMSYYLINKFSKYQMCQQGSDIPNPDYGMDYIIEDLKKVKTLWKQKHVTNAVK